MGNHVEIRDVVCPEMAKAIQDVMQYLQEMAKPFACHCPSEAECLLNRLVDAMQQVAGSPRSIRSAKVLESFALIESDRIDQVAMHLDTIFGLGD